MSKTYTFPCGCSFPIIGESADGVMPLLEIDHENLPRSCPATWELLGKGLTKGIFQLESPLGRQWTKKLKPENEEHISALGAILRPGTLRAVDSDGVSMTQHYCRRKNNEEPVAPYHPAIDAILASTYGVMVYQEQAMAIAVAVAGFTDVEADSLRKAIGKKLPEEMNRCRVLFKDGAAKAGIITSEMADEIFGWITESQKYSFNKCTFGREIIRRPNGGKYLQGPGYSIEEMFKIRTSMEYANKSGHEQLRRKWMRLGHYGRGLSLCSDGRIRPNIVRNITPAGKRTVYKLTTSSGASIRVTGNHKFPTSHGTLTTLEIVAGIANGITICLNKCGEYEESDFTKYNFSTFSQEERESAKGSSGKGVFGKNNRWYTNGSYTLFEEAKAVLPMECQKCGKTNCRLEVNHKDGNRYDSSRENLERLCVSCHKRADYAIGRTKRGEKGYPSILEEVVSVRREGIEETYDVEMDGPNHNFTTASNLVTCNSHSYCYGETGYDCAYLKAHFPVAFFVSWLDQAKNKQDPREEIFELVNDAKLFDIDVLPPDLRELATRFHSEDKKSITFGLADVKGVGAAQLEKLVNAIAETEKELGKPIREWSWNEFLTRCSGKITVSIVDRLIKVGALRWLPKSRQSMLAELEAWNSLTDREQVWYCTLEDIAMGRVTAEEVAGKPEYEPWWDGEGWLEDEQMVDPKQVWNAMSGKEQEKERKKYDKAFEKKVEAHRELSGIIKSNASVFTKMSDGLRAVAKPKQEGGVATKARTQIILGHADIIDKPLTSMNDSPVWVSWVEEDLLGISLSCSKIDACDVTQVNTTCKEILSGRDGFLMIGVEVQRVKEVKTKKGKSPGKKMAFMTVSDGTCCLEMVCFPEAWKEFGHILNEGNLAIIQVERSDSDSFVVKRAWQANQLS